MEQKNESLEYEGFSNSIENKAKELLDKDGEEFKSSNSKMAGYDVEKTDMNEYFGADISRVILSGSSQGEWVSIQVRAKISEEKTNAVILKFEKEEKGELITYQDTMFGNIAVPFFWKEKEATKKDLEVFDWVLNNLQKTKS